MKVSLGVLEEKLRRGEGAEVRERLARWGKRRTHLGRDDSAWAAQLCWRAGLAELGLSLLHPALRPKARRPVKPTIAQRAEYAACLIRAGANEEAAVLLAEISPREYPRVWFYRALVKIASWDYAKAIALLRAYLKSDLAPYDRLVGQLNLAAALIYERKFEQIDPLLRAITHEASLLGLNLVLANSLELSAASFIYRGRARSAEPFLDRARALLSRHGSRDAFYVDKWRGILAFQREKAIGAARRHLDEVRSAARDGGHWESLRDCDRFEAARTREPSLVEKLFVGTPYASYRQRLLAELQWRERLPDVFAWPLSPTEGGPQLDFLFGHRSLKPGQATFRLALALAGDFYRPHRVAPLFARLFPEEYFNPHSSPHRVHELVRRLRAWLKRERLPVRVTERGGAYSFTALRPCALVVPLAPARVTRWRLACEELRRHFPSGNFGVAEAKARLGLSSMSVLRLLGEALRRQALSREGKGKATRYRFAPKV